MRSVCGFAPLLLPQVLLPTWDCVCICGLVSNATFGQPRQRVQASEMRIWTIAPLFARAEP